MISILQDLRYGSRMLLKHPGFTVIALLTLAFGIGANTAIFSVINAVLMRPLPFPEPEQLVRLYEKETDVNVFSDRLEVAPANFLDWQRQSQTLTGIAAWGDEEQALSGAGPAEPVKAAFVSANFLSVLGVSPLLGRDFMSEDDQPGNDSVALLGFGLWQRRFGGGPDLVGQRVYLDGSQYTVIGIMPVGFEFPRSTEIWTPLALNVNQTQTREAHFLQVIGRRRAAVPLSQVRLEMETIAASLARQYPATNRNWTVNSVALLEDEVGGVRSTMLLLMGAVGLVLLIACANVSSLLLARGAGRGAEIKVRAALGASRPRIIRQLLTESALLAAMGGSLGLLFALWSTAALLTFSPTEIPRLETVSVDYRVLAFTLAITLLTSVLFGLVPALQGARLGRYERLRENGRGSPTNSAQRRIFNALVVSEIALALLVLLGAGLLLNSFLRLRRVELGIETPHVLTVEVNLPSARYSGNDWKEQRLNFYGQVIARIRALPGVDSVGAIESLPLSGSQRGWTFRKEGQDLPPSERPVAGFQVATIDYFRVMGLQIRRGRLFTEADRDGSAQVAIVNESFVQRFYPNQDPLGRRITIRNQPQPSEIVGIVNDVRHFGPSTDPGPEMYVSYQQFALGAIPLVVRATSEPERLTASVRKEIEAVDPEVAVGRVRTMAQIMSASVAEWRFALFLFGTFAAMALLLAVIGIYGVMACAVTRRSQEFGVRIALGADSRDLLKLVLRQGIRLTLAGVAIGLAAALALTRLLASLLFGVSATDPLTFLGMATLLTVAALLACWIPARRATRVDPVIVLAGE